MKSIIIVYLIFSIILTSYAYASLDVGYGSDIENIPQVNIEYPIIPASGNGTTINNYYNVSGGNMSYQVDNFNVTNQLNATSIYTPNVIIAEQGITQKFLLTNPFHNIFNFSNFNSGLGLNTTSGWLGFFMNGRSTENLLWGFNINTYTENINNINITNITSQNITANDMTCTNNINANTITFAPDGGFYFNPSTFYSYDPTGYGAVFQSYNDLGEKTNFTFFGDAVSLQTFINKLFLPALTTTTSTTSVIRLPGTASRIDAGVHNGTKGIFTTRADTPIINSTHAITYNANITNILTINYAVIPAWNKNLNGSIMHNLTGLYYANNTAWSIWSVD